MTEAEKILDEVTGFNFASHEDRIEFRKAVLKKFSAVKVTRIHELANELGVTKIPKSETGAINRLCDAYFEIKKAGNA